SVAPAVMEHRYAAPVMTKSLLIRETSPLRQVACRLSLKAFWRLRPRDLRPLTAGVDGSRDDLGAFFDRRNTRDRGAQILGVPLSMGKTGMGVNMARFLGDESSWPRPRRTRNIAV